MLLALEGSAPIRLGSLRPVYILSVAAAALRGDLGAAPRRPGEPDSPERRTAVPLAPATVPRCAGRNAHTETPGLRCAVDHNLGGARHLCGVPSAP